MRSDDSTGKRLPAEVGESDHEKIERLEDQISNLYQAQAKNESLIEYLRNRLNLERTCAVVGFFIVVDLWAFPTMYGWSSFSLLILELLVIFAVAYHNGVTEVTDLFRYAVGAFSPTGAQSSDEGEGDYPANEKGSENRSK